MRVRIKKSITVILFAIGCRLFLAGGSIRGVPTLSRATAFSASAQGLPKKPFAILPDKIPWQKNPDPDTRETAYPVGALDKPGMYIQLVRWLPNTTAEAHSHSDDRYGFVASGTFYHGIGDKFDSRQLEVRPAGTFFTEPAGAAHFGATRAEGTVLYFVGTGPSAMTLIEK